MNVTTPRLLVLALWATSPGAAVETQPLADLPEQPEVKIRVIQPGTNKLVYKAEVSVYTTRERPERICGGLTGLSGEPFDAATRCQLDPSFSTLLVVAEKHGIAGSMEITYDHRQYYWKQAYDPVRRLWRADHNRGDWRPQVVYQYDDAAKDWKSVAYAVWKADLDATEKGRIDLLEQAFIDAVEEELNDAADRGLIEAAGRQRMAAAMKDLLALDLKAPLGPNVNARIAEAISVQAAPDLEGRLRDLVMDLIADVRTGAPEPPVIRLRLRRAYRIPVRSHVDWLPAGPCLIVPR